MNTYEKKYVETIVKEYEEKEPTKLDELRQLDKKVKKPADIFSFIFGGLGCLILGIGMCISLKVILEDFFWLGIVIGCLGLFMVSINYFIYQKILKSRRKTYRPQIEDLSKELLKSES